MKRAFLLAHPAGHSISPAIHNAAFQHLDIDANYQALDVAPDRLAEVVERLRQADCLGANVTIPHKLAVMPLLDELSHAAEAIGAVNTIINQDGSLLGHNTDASGFLRALTEDAGLELQHKTALMLGAGGAARAVAYALLDAGVARLWVYNRSQEKAAALADAFAAQGKIQQLEQEGFEQVLKSCDLLINTTSVGMMHGGIDPHVSPLPEGLLPKKGFVCDIIYRPEQTRLLLGAKACGLLTQNGLPMLIYQAADAFSCWTGVAAPIDQMREAALKALRV